MLRCEAKQAEADALADLLHAERAASAARAKYVAAINAHMQAVAADIAARG